MRDIALTLRKAIADANALTVEDITKGEIVVPDLLTTFTTYLITGQDVKCGNSTSKNRWIDSIYQIFLFAASAEKKRNQKKHLKVGLVIKNTSDRK